MIARAPEEMDAVFSLRHTVFMEEQQVDTENEKDSHEEESMHFLLRVGGKPAGAGRLRIVDGNGKAERVCVLKDNRNSGSGRLLMAAMESFAAKKGLPAIILNAQSHAIGFYEKLGYSIISEEFIEAGIPHQTMKKDLASN